MLDVMLYMRGRRRLRRSAWGKTSNATRYPNRGITPRDEMDK